ncbi:MAG: flavodoxin [Firmicutes bacterium HGW-Firmicutes-7]|nr:MAG: flavodoxin [Firmicutes bacterium HGW-Firmicutes-7]
MKKVCVIYWSGTGNTQSMAEALAEGAKSKGASVKLLNVSDAVKEDVLEAEVIALGCPSMGSENLEESEMEPFVEELEGEDLSGKHFVLFGSYDWGDGQWMQEWEERMTNKGVKLVESGLIVQNTPEEDELEKYKTLGNKLATI